MADWSPSNYLRFEDERTRAARDLLAGVPLEDARRVVDLGCGPGNSTELLAERFPGADLLGLDNSPAMLEAARRRLPRARFAAGDASSWIPEASVDLVFANAVYQWVLGHLAQLVRVVEAMRQRAVLAMQVPDNLTEPSHGPMEAVAREGPWAARIADAARDPLPSFSDYYDALAPHAARIDLWRTIYVHPLSNAGAIAEMYASTGLRPFLEPLTPNEAAAFRRLYEARLAKAYPPAADGKVLLRTPRLFLVAVH